MNAIAWEAPATGPLMLTSVLISTAGALRTVSPLAGVLGLVPLPGWYCLLLAAILLCNVVLTQWVKTWLYGR